MHTYNDTFLNKTIINLRHDEGRPPKIPQIKLVRQILEVGLKEAKDIVERRDWDDDGYSIDMEFHITDEELGRAVRFVITDNRFTIVSIDRFADGPIRLPIRAGRP